MGAAISWQFCHLRLQPHENKFCDVLGIERKEGSSLFEFKKKMKAWDKFHSGSENSLPSHNILEDVSFLEWNKRQQNNIR